jgi:hypothetical protein
MIKSMFTFLALVFVCSCATADSPAVIDTNTVESSLTIALGDTSVVLEVTHNGPGPVFVALHENESTSILAGQQTLQLTGGTMIILRHGGTRNVSFLLDGVEYEFDPNRMFTDVGIRQALGGSPSDEAVLAVSTLAQTITSAIGDRSVIALHNSTNDNYSIMKYLPGQSLSGDATEVHRVPTYDSDDFFFTTDVSLYEYVIQGGFNVVLQSPNAVNDGSLSVYSSMYGLEYINVEAEHGHSDEQLQMLSWLVRYWQ